MLVRRWVAHVLRVALSLLMVFALSVAAATTVYLRYNARHVGRIMAGVTILDVDVGGLTTSEAVERLQRHLDATSLPYVRLKSGEAEWTLGTRALGAHLDLEAAAREALALGRCGPFRVDLVTRLRLLWWGYDIVPAFGIEPGKALNLLRSVAREAGHPARRAELWINGLQVGTDESQVGREMRVEASRQAIEMAVRATLGESHWGETPRIWRVLSPSATRVRAERDPAPRSPFPVQPIDVRVAFQEVTPPLTEIEGGRERAERVLSGPVVAFFPFVEIQPNGSTEVVTRRWAVDRARLARWLTVQQETSPEGVLVRVEVDHEPIRAWVHELAQEIARNPRDGRFGYDPDTERLSALTIGQNGFALDEDAAVRALAEGCLSLPETGGRTVQLPVRVVPPRVTYRELEANLPLYLVGQGTSQFVGSSAERLQNIRTATSRFQGVAIPTGGTFSFLAHLGHVTVASGYSESWVIMGGQTVLGPGGGVCQVSTTCFRAAFYAGLPIVERWPHSYRVGWYEPPVGLDAAVYHPTTDLKFVNDTGAPLLLQTEVDAVNSTLTFRLYGRDTGRKVAMEGPEVGDPVPPGDPVVEDDPTMLIGSRVLVERARDGVDVTVYRVISGPGASGEREPFHSQYRPWPARYRIGTKAE